MKLDEVAGLVEGMRAALMDAWDHGFDAGRTAQELSEDEAAVERNKDGLNPYRDEGVSPIVLSMLCGTPVDRIEVTERGVIAHPKEGSE